MNYLLALQNFREGGSQWLAVFLNGISTIANNFLMIIPIVIFWCVSRESGYWYMLNMGIANFINNMVKLTFCVYRPWVLDERIKPYEGAVAEATGYSFPSGHSVAASSVYGSIGVRNWKSRKWVSVVMFLLILLTAFSRNYLGVHTPQDVLVGIAEGFVVIAFNTWLLNHIRGDGKKQDLWTVIGIVLSVISVIFLLVKSYPMDYVDGVLLVDPVEKSADGFQGIGILFGFLIGSVWERKVIHYDVTGTVPEKILRAIVGIALALLIYKVVRKALIRAIGIQFGTLIGMSLFGFFIVGLFPFLVMKVKNVRSGKK